LRALDLGTGGGHVAYALAGAAGAVTAVDPSSDMLAVVAAEAERRGLRNVETVQAVAEDLPFHNGNFDFLASRYSAHHWRDAAAGLREARRVLRPGATALFVDIVAPETPAFDTHLQAVELLRDVSHVRDYSVAQWLALLAKAGFSAPAPVLRMEFSEWTRRIGTPAPLAAAIRLLQRKTDDATHAHFGIEADGSFWLDAAMFEATAV
jgi:ubiquinone/menaquinone biosynthesis C-methylase UbiE